MVWNRRKSQTPSTEGHPRVTARSTDRPHRWIEAKVFSTEEFGYRTITVEQPLRLVYSVDADKIEQAMAAKPVAVLDKDHRHNLRAALEMLEQSWTWTNQADFIKALGPALSAHGVALEPAVYKTAVAAFAESSPEGEIVETARGKVEADSSLRDTENVPLTEDMDAYVKREVLPWAPDAWMDESKTKIGYEIPFTRIFYNYIPPRPLAEIDADVQAAIARVQALFAEMKA